MNWFISDQLNIFLWSIVIGGALALLYDAFRILRRIVKHSKWIVGIEDLIFWMATSIIVFRYIFEANDGSIRSYIFLGICLGALLYTLTLSKLIVNTLTKVIREIIKLTTKVLNIILKPIRIILSPFIFVNKKAHTGLKKSRKWTIMKLRTLKKDIYLIRKKI